MFDYVLVKNIMSMLQKLNLRPLLSNNKTYFNRLGRCFSSRLRQNEKVYFMRIVQYSYSFTAGCFLKSYCSNHFAIISASYALFSFYDNS